MDSIRQKQVAELIRRNFSMVLVAEGRYIYGSTVMVTVTNVVMSPDMSLAKIYISIFNAENKETVLNQMDDHYPRLKQALHQKIRKQLRIMPEFKLFIDDMVDEMYNVDALFNKLKKTDQEKAPE